MLYGDASLLVVECVYLLGKGKKHCLQKSYQKAHETRSTIMILPEVWKFWLLCFAWRRRRRRRHSGVKKPIDSLGIYEMLIYFTTPHSPPLCHRHHHHRRARHCHAVFIDCHFYISSKPHHHQRSTIAKWIYTLCTQ